MSLEWHGQKVKQKVATASKAGVNATMQAAIIHARGSHGAGSHVTSRFESHTGELERSLRIVMSATVTTSGVVVGRWGSMGVNYARRIELGFQGKDSLGRTFNQPNYPFLRPAASAEYPKLTGRIRRGFSGA